MSEADRARIQDYLARHGISELLYTVLENICLDRPENPHQFIVDYMHTHFPDQVASSSSAPTGHHRSSIQLDEEEEEEEEEEEVDDDDDDDVGEMPASGIPVVSNAGRRRTAVSAESMSPAATTEQYSKVVYEKSPAHRLSLQDILRENFLFKGLDAEQMTTLLDAMFMATFKAGETVIEQGAEGDNYYVVFDGACDAFVGGKDGAAPQLVHSYSVGGSFGELALMYNAPRAATVRAASDCALFAVDRVTFKCILMDTAVKRRDEYSGFLEQASGAAPPRLTHPHATATCRPRTALRLSSRSSVSPASHALSPPASPASHALSPPPRARAGKHPLDTHAVRAPHDGRRARAAAVRRRRGDHRAGRGGRRLLHHCRRRGAAPLCRLPPPHASAGARPELCT